MPKPLLYFWNKTVLPFKATIELLALLSLIIALNLVIFIDVAGPQISISPLVYLIFPPLLWTALRFDKKTVTAVLFITSVMAIVGTTKGLGPFVKGSLSESLTYLQIFLGVMYTTILSLTVVVSQQKKAEKSLEILNMELDRKVEERTSALVKNEQMFRLLVQGVRGYTIFILDPKGHVVSWNEGGKYVKGYSQEEIIGKPFAMFYTKEDQQNNKPEKLLKIVIKKGYFEEEGWRVRKDGSEFWASALITAMYNDNRDLVGFSEIVRDLTESKSLEDIKNRQLDYEIELERKEREFIAVASHQLLTPLTLIEGYISMLLSGKLGNSDKTAKKYLSESLEGAKRMGGLIKSLLTTSRIEDNSMQVKKSVFDLNELVAEVCGIFKQRINQKGLKMEFIVSKPVKIIADINHTREVITNLLDNAIKYSEKGSISINIETNSRFAIVSIADTGIGIEPSNLKHIFEKFYLSENWLSKQSQSNGLGLYITKLLITLMGGTIKVESKLGQGSRFIFTLPLAKKYA